MGMWMGGMPPLGYDVKNRKLVVNGGEACIIVEIYRRYLALKSVHALRDELAAAGIKSKRLPITSASPDASCSAREKSQPRAFVRGCYGHWP
jgi:hypothetical protein